MAVLPIHAVRMDVSEMIAQRESMHLVWLGILLAVAGNILIAIGFVLQKAVHIDEVRRKEEAAKLASSTSSDSDSSSASANAQTRDHLFYLRCPKWWLGLACIAGGETGNLFAFGFASGSIVPPIGAVALVAVALLSRIFLKERLSTLNWVALAVCILGVAILGAFGLTSSLSEASLSARDIKILLAQPEVYGMGLIVATAWFCCLVVWLIRPDLAQKHVIVFAALAGLAAAAKTRAFKAAMQMFWFSVGDGPSQIGTAVFWLTAFTAIILTLLGIFFINLGQAYFTQSLYVPSYFAIFTAFSVSSSVAMYREWENQSTHRIAGFSVGLTLVLVGVAGLSIPSDVFRRASKSAPDKEGDQSKVLEAIQG